MESSLQYTVFEFGLRKVAGLFQSLGACCKGQHIINFVYRAVLVGKSTWVIMELEMALRTGFRQGNISGSKVERYRESPRVRM